MTKTADDIIKVHMGDGCRPLHFLKSDPSGVKRFNMVTDSCRPHSLLGGVGTALILSTLICIRNNWRLRIITRTTENNPIDYYSFMKLCGIGIPGAGVEFASDNRTVSDNGLKQGLYGSWGGESPRIEWTTDDIFLATSWWSARALLDSDFVRHIFYIIQEEETFFYNFGDMHLWCHEMMCDGRIDYIVNSRLLYDYFKKNNYGLLTNHCASFEPAFPEDLYCAGTESFRKKTRYRLFFYGRPNNPRNLFCHGLQAIQDAIDSGVLNPDSWEICMAGGDIEPFCFKGDVQPKLYGRMPWQEYADFARSVDLALCLMYTPHPSYPPLDMLASGAVVLTNNFANKRDLKYSDNLVMTELQSMSEGFVRAVSLAKNPELRRRNYESQLIGRDWESALESAISYVTEKTNTHVEL